MLSMTTWTKTFTREPPKTKIQLREMLADVLYDDEHGEATLDVMRAIKRAIDPENIMNPGKIFGPMN